MATAPVLPPAADELVPLVELAAQFDLCPVTVRGWIKNGVAGHKLRVFKRGRKWFIRPSWLAAFIDKLNR